MYNNDDENLRQLSNIPCEAMICLLARCGGKNEQFSLTIVIDKFATRIFYRLPLYLNILRIHLK